MVQLVERLQAYAVFLGNEVHRLAVLDVVQTAFVVLRGVLLLLLQPDDFTLLQLVVAVALVVAGYLLIRDAYLLANGAEGVATTGIEEIVLVVNLNGMQLLAVKWS